MEILIQGRTDMLRFKTYLQILKEKQNEIGFVDLSEKVSVRQFGQ